MPPYPLGDGDDAGADDLSDVLNFSGAGGSVAEDDEQPAAWDFSVADDADEASAVEYEAQGEDDGGGGEEDEEEGELFTVTNPPGTVSVSARVDGGVDRVALSEKVTAMTETQLAEEIRVMAHLAGEKGQAAQHTFLTEIMRQLGGDDTEAIGGFLRDDLNLASPEQAETTQARVFATRYPTDK